jgi:hypothetical protein
VLDSMLEPIAGVECRRKVSPLGEVITLMTSSYTLPLLLSQIFYLLKHLLPLYLVILNKAIIT